VLTACGRVEIMKNVKAKVLLFVLAFCLSMGSSAMAQYTVGVKVETG
jgi:hypothetical protein